MKLITRNICIKAFIGMIRNGEIADKCFLRTGTLSGTRAKPCVFISPSSCKLNKLIRYEIPSPLKTYCDDFSLRVNINPLIDDTGY